ncbi:ribosomal protein L17 [Runella defluvii]|uniref:Ribosomal protein L17 n=1 Tax=Runella defluvii TaxID=370973 RepID=A0A7W6ESV9_9BACT|nr:hypothetical protein [Runella defluvii]MBB3841048.1 ribosomal protein L17 [Runella defluvii]
MRKITVFILLICTNICWAQNNKLNGIVVEQSSGSKPVAEVRISANRANVTLSATDGRFILTFQSLFAGDNIGVSVQKEGWEVVNEKELQTVIASNYTVRPLKIVLCKAGTINQNRIKYYNVSVNYITKRFEEEITKAKQENQHWQEKVQKLEKDKEFLLSQANELAERYSRVNFDDVSAIEKQAFDLYQEGKIKEAIALLESVDSEALIRKAKEAKQKWQKNKDSTIRQEERIKPILKADSTLKNKQ